MARALAEAEKGRGRTSPNPIVGAVVARGSRVVGVGHHMRAGTPHAEVHALRAAAPVIAALPPAQVGRQVIRLAHRLHLDHPTVTEAVTDALTGLIDAGNYPTPRQSRQPGPNPDRAPATCGVARTGSQQRAQGSRRSSRQDTQDRTPTARPPASQDFPHTVHQAVTRPAATTRPPSRGATDANRRPLMPRRIPR